MLRMSGTFSPNFIKINFKKVNKFLMKLEGEKMIKSMVEALTQIGPSFKLEPFATIIQPIIQEVLAEQKKTNTEKALY